MANRSGRHGCEGRSRPAAHRVWGLVSAVVLLAGCEGRLRPGDPLWKSSELAYTVSIHQLVPEAEAEMSRLARSVRADDGSTYYIRRLPLLDSGAIRRVEVQPVENADDAVILKAHLDRHGRMIWYQVCAEHASEPAAVLLNGRFHKLLRIPRRLDRGRPVPLGEWPAWEAEKIAAHAPQNYARLRE